MTIHGEVSRTRVVARGFNIANRSPWQHVGNVLGDICPCLAAIASDLQQPIIRSRPDHSGFFRRLGDCKDHSGILDADVVSGKPAGKSLPALVVQG